MNTAPGTPDGPGVLGISHIVIEVADMARAMQFYHEILGIRTFSTGRWPVADETALALPSGQMLVLKSAADANLQDDSAVHQAYLCNSETRSAIADKLDAAGIPIQRYHEDRPAEIQKPFYFADPDGNRIQLVTAPVGSSGIWGIDHAAIQASDMEWEEEFFIGRLGFPVDHRVGWNTDDYVRAQAWAEGRDDMAPGTRRMDHRYRDNPGAEPGTSREVPRPNIQLFLGLGGAALGIFLATRHRQEPPPGATRGAPRTALATDPGGLDSLANALDSAGITVEGPVTHDLGAPLAQSLYFRDPCGNFFEICVPVENP